MMNALSKTNGCVLEYVSIVSEWNKNRGRAILYGKDEPFIFFSFG